MKIKRILSMLMAAFMVASLAACGGSPAPSSTEPAPTPYTPAYTDPPPQAPTTPRIPRFGLVTGVQTCALPISPPTRYASKTASRPWGNIDRKSVV